MLGIVRQKIGTLRHVEQGKVSRCICFVVLLPTFHHHGFSRLAVVLCCFLIMTYYQGLRLVWRLSLFFSPMVFVGFTYYLLWYLRAETLYGVSLSVSANSL